MLSHVLSRLMSELFAGDRQFGPAVERVAIGRVWDTHELGSNRPVKGSTLILLEGLARGESYYIFGVDEKPIQVEYAGADGRETDYSLLVYCSRVWRVVGTYPAFSRIAMGADLSQFDTT